MRAKNDLTHCPHCKRQLWDERLDEEGWPRIDTIWELPTDDLGPGRRLRITEVEVHNRFGRDIRGYVCFKTKDGGKEYDVDNEEFYTTSMENFAKIWLYDPNVKRDFSKLTGIASQVG
jgi:hypothetical protein